MTRNYDDEGTVRQYLLGQLTSDGQRSIEEHLMTEDASLEELEAAEDELIDAYLAGKLSNAEHDLFEQHFLNTRERERRLQFARVLRRYVQTNASPGEVPAARSWTHLLSLPTLPTRITAFALLLVLVVGYWAYRNPPLSPQTFATITLSRSSSSRAEGAQAGRVKLPLNSEALKIALVLPEGLTADERYRVEMENEVGETRRLEVTEQNAKQVTVVIPASQLMHGQYAVKLFATSSDGTERVNGPYFFTVE